MVVGRAKNVGYFSILGHAGQQDPTLLQYLLVPGESKHRVLLEAGRNADGSCDGHDPR